MHTYYDCIPCFINQTISVLEMVNASDKVREATMRQVLTQLSNIDFHLSPPAMARSIHHTIRTISGSPDPFAAEKQRYQKLALTLLPRLEQMVANSDNPLHSAVLLAIAGNSIDHGVYHNMSEQRALDAIDVALKAELFGEIDTFATAVNNAESILYLADNAGEIVLDRLLLQQLPAGKTTLAVRGSAIINDALTTDAMDAGISELATIVDNGDATPGTLLEYCSEEFKQLFAAADIIIAKGQGNYETLSDCNANIFFLLKAKCPVVARHIGCEVGCAVLHHK